MTFFCQNLDAQMADLRAHGVKLEKFDMPGATIKDGVYDRNGQRRLVPEGNLLAVAERPDDFLS
jgi:hypothetical protein